MAAKTKPLHALGRLEDIAVQLAVLQKTLSPVADRARVCVFGADHGVADEGVSAYPRAVTGEMMRNFGRGGAAINVIAAANDIDVEVIDVGVDADLSGVPGIRHERVRAGTRNIRREVAMTADELRAALSVGAAAARRAADDGIRVLGLGEMGIANTTAASALLCALSGAPASTTVGRGTGIDDQALAHKYVVVDDAVKLHCGDGRPGAREVLRRLGGLELAAIAGAALAAAPLQLAVVVDGFISTAAALCAVAITAEEDPAAVDRLVGALFFAHRSNEQAHGFALAQCAARGCNAAPLLDLGLRLGEGTGAALAIPLLRAAAAVMRDMATFASAGVSAGEHADAHGGAT